MKQDRFLVVIIGVIVLLAVLSIVLFFVKQEPQEYGPDDTPEGVLRNYVLALQKKDFETAYGYLQDSEDKPSLAQFKQAFFSQGTDPSNASVQIGAVTITGSDAIVAMTLIHSNNDPFNRTWDENSNALLTQQNSEWRIANMPYPYWGWDWYVKKTTP
jgi:hypothetical protein